MLQLISGLLWISGLWIWWLVSYWFPTEENPLWLQNITWQEICAAVFAVLNHGLDLFSKDWDILHGRLCFGASSVLHELMSLSDLNVMCVRGQVPCNQRCVFAAGLLLVVYEVISNPKPCCFMFCKDPLCGRYCVQFKPHTVMLCKGSMFLSAHGGRLPCLAMQITVHEAWHPVICMTCCKPSLVNASLPCRPP